ncbi:MAG: ISAs1 family transposase [Planctomicrobium sp.]|nr:ISAs1 family transposase [Planctomicrobium sp.]
MLAPYAQRSRAAKKQRHSTVNKGHGRIERRTLTSTTSLNHYLNWPGVQQVCRVERKRTIAGKTTNEVCYFTTSVSRTSANAAQLLALSRDHWGAIENGLHYVRDEAMAEDRSTIFRGHAPQNLAAMRNAALNWLRRNEIHKIAPTLRSFTQNPLRLFTKLGYQN